MTNRGRGRPNGAKNKINVRVTEAIEKAFQDVGGAKYLRKVAEEDPKTFCTLLGKILPREIKGTLEGGLVLNVISAIEEPPGANTDG